MKKKLHMMKRCQAFAMAGLIGAGTLMPGGTALAAGPGDSLSSIVTDGGPGGPGGPGALEGPGGPGGTVSAEPGTGKGGGKAAANENPNAWKKVNGSYQMPDGSAIRDVLLRGIDVSRWQGDIDWNQVASDDVSFVMLGTRSKGGVDPYFHQNIKQASAAGVKVGVYIYSLATTPQMAVDEAGFILDLIHDYPVSYPVAFDMEDSVQGALPKDELAAIANAFCTTISQAGYYPIIYANDNWLANKLDMGSIHYPVWVARYSARPVFQNPVMWQATSTGMVKGIGGNVDIDFQFKDFTPVIPANTWRTVQGNTYYYQNYVKQKNSWIDDGTGWFYMDGSGLASKGWLTLSGTSYYLDEGTGRMVTGWKQANGQWYYFGGSGALSRGWIDDNGTWYYSDSRGVMQTGWMDENGRRYYLNNSGAMQSGWLNQDGKWYYLDHSGVLSRGWINDNGIWYYSDRQGVMQTGWLDEAGNRYFLKSSGAMATGWREIDGAWYYFEESGHMARGMIDVNGLHYYMEPSTGRMAAGTGVDIGGTAYQADAKGVLTQVQAGGGQTGGGTEGQTEGAPGGQPGSTPNSQPGSTPGGQPGSAPNSQSGSTPGGQTGSTPGGQSGSVPNSQPGSTPGSQSGSVPGSQSAAGPGGQTESTSGVQTGAAPGSGTGGSQSQGSSQGTSSGGPGVVVTPVKGR